MDFYFMQFMKMISIIIVDYHSMEKTLEYIDHVAGHMRNCGELHFIVVDNYSESYSDKLQLLASENQQYQIDEKKVESYQIKGRQIYYYFANANLGYAKGNNAGIEISKALFDDEYYIVSNNDLEIVSDIDWGIIEDVFAKDEKICVVGLCVVGTDGNHQSPYRRLPAFRTLVTDYLVFGHIKRRDDLNYDGSSKYCYRINGCFMIIRASIFNLIGCFDPNTFMYCEEMILSERLGKHGYKTYYLNDIGLIHRHAETVKKYVNLITAEEWMHDSYKYYFKTYRDTQTVLLILSDLSFKIYKCRLYTARKIREIISHFR